MFLSFTYNSKVNLALKKLGKTSRTGVDVFEENFESAAKLQEALKEKVLVEITAIQEISKWQQSIDFCGETIAKATGRDSGAFIPPHIAKISGVATSGGSVRNWHTIIKEGSVFQVHVPKIIFEKYAQDYEKEFSYKIVLKSEKSVDDLI